MTASGISRSRRFCPAMRALLCGAIAIMAACGGSDATRPPPPPPPPPPDVWHVVAGRPWTMPGATEGYKCYAVHLTSDEYLTGFRLVAPPPAQNEVLITLSDTPVTEGSFDCNPGSLDKHLIYAASGPTGPIEFPSGFGVHASAGQYLLLNVHVNNVADTTVVDSTLVEARIGTAADVATPIDMMMAGTFLINIPSDGQAHTASGTCFASDDNHLLAFLPLMRSAGTHQRLSIVADTTTQVVYDQDFDLLHDNYTLPATPIQISSGTRLNTLCSYQNNSGATLMFGESSHNESCFSAVYRYPVSATSSLYDCAEGIASFDMKRE